MVDISVLQSNRFYVVKNTVSIMKQQNFNMLRWLKSA